MISWGLPGTPVVRVALVLSCGTPSLADRASALLDDSLSMMQVTRRLSHEFHGGGEAAPCYNTDNGALSATPFLETCNTVVAPGSEFLCPSLPGTRDDSDFSLHLMCCVCGGGSSTPPTSAPEAEPTSAPTLAPSSAPTTVPTAGPTSAPISTPTSAPTSAPTNAPTPAPTLAPTSAPEKPATATGDPHVTNVDGVRFEILKAGVQELLRLPRRANKSHGSVEPSPLLSVSAIVDPADEDTCHEMYVKQVDVTGGWLRSSGPLRFRAGGDSLDDPRAISLSVNGSLVDRAALERDGRVQRFLEVTEASIPHVDPTTNTIQKVPMFAVKLSFAAATLNIDWMHRAVPGGKSMNHLNFRASGLRRFSDSSGMDIGGILGRDDHSDAASLPGECKLARADLRVSNTAPGDGGDLQVIAAAL